MLNINAKLSSSQFSPRAVRDDAFQKKIPHDNQLDELVRDHPSHSFISNKASQYTYQYLIEYLLKFSEKWFDKPATDLRILDWGCGKGQITYLLKKENVPVVSCDIMDEGHNDSAFGQDVPIIRKTNVNVVPLQHEYLLPFADESFDVVLSFGVLEHVPKDTESLNEIHRVLTPNGLFFCFFLPYPYSWTQKLAHMRGEFYHDRFYSRTTINRLLKENGMTLIDFWHRALLPKNKINYGNFYRFEALDQFLCENTFLRHFATNVEFVATKPA